MRLVDAVIERSNRKMWHKKAPLMRGFYSLYTRFDYAKLLLANSQLTNAQKFSRYLGRALR